MAVVLGRCTQSIWRSAGWHRRLTIKGGKMENNDVEPGNDDPDDVPTFAVVIAAIIVIGHIAAGFILPIAAATGGC